MASTTAENENAPEEVVPPLSPGAEVPASVPTGEVALPETEQADDSMAEVADEKKSKVSKEKKPRATKRTKAAPAHPPYFEMIKEAICALKERGGSSPMAIAKYMEAKHKTQLPANFKKFLAVQIKKLVLSGKLTKVKASFKLSESAKKEAPKKKGNVKKTSKPAVKTAKKEIVKKTVRPAAKTVKKKGIAKKTAKPKVTSASTKAAKPASKPKVSKNVTKSAAGKAPAGKAPAAKVAKFAKKPVAGKKPAPAKKVAAAPKSKPAVAKKPKSMKSSAKSPAAKSKTKAASAPPAKKADRKSVV